MANNYKDFSISALSSEIQRIPLYNTYLENLNITEFTGEAGSGKTQMCIHIIMYTIMPKKVNGLEKGCLYISTVQKMSEIRFQQFFSYYSEGLNNEEQNLAYYRYFNKQFNPSEFEKFFHVEVEEFIVRNNIKTIIIDSITGIADTQFINENNEVDYKERSKFIRLYTKIFKELIFKYNLFFFVTNNVSASFDGDDEPKPCLGKLWENGLSTRILLKKSKGLDDRVVRTMK